MLWIGRTLPRGSSGILVLAALLAVAVGAQAVVHTTGDGSGNTHATPPADDPGIDNVGKAGGQTGVYLGNGWVLTADHVGPQAIDLLGITYAAIPGSFRQFAHSPTEDADLGVYRIDGSPALPSPVVSSTAPSVGEEVIAAGRGWTREPGLTFWDVSWVEVTPPPPAAFSGYKRATGSVVRWGRNEIDVIDMDVEASGRVSRTFLLTFDDAGGLPDEMQTVTKDSGGGVFVKRGGAWELAGINAFQFVEMNQPIDTAVFGNLSGIVDLSFYHDQILATINPQIPGIPGPYLLAAAGLLLAAARPVLRR